MVLWYQRWLMVLRTEYFTSLSTLLETYQIQAKTEGKSPNTIRIYTTTLTILERFLKRRGHSTGVTGIGPEEIREFISYLQNTKAFMEHPFTGPQQKGLTGHTINCYLRAIRAFWSWLLAEEFIETNPFDKIIISKPPKKIIMPFSDDQIRALLGVIDTKSPIGFRNWTIILTLLDSYQIQAMTEGKSPNTIRIYTTALTILQRFLERQGYSTGVTRIGPEKIRNSSATSRIQKHLWSIHLPSRSRKA